MAVGTEVSNRGWALGSSHSAACLTDKFEVIKEIGDGSFGSVSLARVRSAGAHVARRGTLVRFLQPLRTLARPDPPAQVAIKTMKKTFESFAPCLELREIIFLRTLPNHVHLVPALDIFLDPLTKKLHIAMEYMDGNLYQLMKARDHKPFDGSSVKSILLQILAGLEHIHDHGFFHRDIKPENILVSVSAREDVGSAFKRYSQLMTPPSTPPTYSIKLADFGLARETYSKTPYTTYVSTRWYRAPEVLLRAGEYSAPVDIWALGAMAVEIATLKPLFPGGNEVDQVWRVCEIMGSPGNWVNRSGQRVGGGEWKDGVKLAQKLGFSFPKMAPHTLDTILTQPQWPASLTHFVTWCLMWDPKARPTSIQAMQHEYFSDAVDPLRPKSSGSKLLGRKQSEIGSSHSNDGTSSLTSKTSSWFRRSLVARESAPAVPQVQTHGQGLPSPAMSPAKPEPALSNPKNRPSQLKRNTWTNGTTNNAAPMPILPSIRPVSPLSAQVNAQAASAKDQEKPRGKIGRQLSVASHGNHYMEPGREEAEAALNGRSGVTSPSGGQKESFFSHLRKRARRLSGKHQIPMSPKYDVPENNASASWAAGGNGGHSSRNSVTDARALGPLPAEKTDFADLDRALQNLRYSLDAQNAPAAPVPAPPPAAATKAAQRSASNPLLKRHYSVQGNEASRSGRVSPGLSASRSTRRAAHKPTLASNQYETPDEQEELLDEALSSAHVAVTRLDQEALQRHGSSSVYNNAKPLRQSQSDVNMNAYPTPSASANRNSVQFNGAEMSGAVKPINISAPHKPQNASNFPWPTPPYEENDWASQAAASISAAGEHWR